MDLRFRTAVAVLIAVTLALLGVPLLVGWYLHGAGAIVVAGTVISCVAVLNGIIAAWWRSWPTVLRWIMSGADVTSAAARIHDVDGACVGLGLAIGRRRVLTTRDAVTAARARPGQPASAEVSLEFEVQGRTVTRVGRPGGELPPRGRRHPAVTVLDLTEALPSAVRPVSPARSSAEGDAEVLYLDPDANEVRLDRRSLADSRVTGLTVPAGTPGAGGFVLRSRRGRVIGMLAARPVAGGLPDGRTITDPAVVLLPPPVDLAGDRHRSWGLAAVAAASSLVLGLAGWLAWPFPRPATDVVQVAGWKAYFDDPGVQDVLGDGGIATSVDNRSGQDLLAAVGSGRYGAFTVSNDVSKELLLQELDHHHLDRLTGRLFQEPMVVGTYASVLRALERDPRHLLARRGADGAWRLDSRALVRSLAAQDAASRRQGDTAGLLRWSDLGDFPTSWNRNDPVSITVASPCGAGAGAIFAGTVLRDLRADGSDPAALASRVAGALHAAYVGKDASQHTAEDALAWADPQGTPPSPFTFMYLNAAMTALANAPAEPRGLGDRVLLQLDVPVVTSQYLITLATDRGRTLLDLTTGTSERTQRLQTVLAGRFGLRFPGEAAQRARQDYLDRYPRIAAALTASGAGLDDGGGAAAVALPELQLVRPFLHTLCPDDPALLPPGAP